MQLQGYNTKSNTGIFLVLERLGVKRGSELESALLNLPRLEPVGLEIVSETLLGDFMSLREVGTGIASELGDLTFDSLGEPV